MKTAIFAILSSFAVSFSEPQIFKALNLKVIEKRDLGSLNEYVVEKNGKKIIIYETKDRKYLIIGAVFNEIDDSK